VETNLQKIANDMVLKVENFIKNNESVDSYDYEKGISKILQDSGHQMFQASIGEIPKGINSKVTIKTTLGEIVVPKDHPMSSRPMGFHISPCLQEHICRLGSKLVFSEASEEFWQFFEIDISDKQIERVCHCYGEEIDKIDWKNAYSDSVQLKISHQNKEAVYVMVDGSMLLTREDSWKEIKLGRIFGGDSIIDISKNRTLLTNSVYMAHLGTASEFWEKFSVEIPSSKNLVFINDGAKWIWNYIKDCYPDSTQILDFYHCKEHICQFSTNFFPTKEAAKLFSDSICQMLLSEKVDEALDKLRDLECSSQNKKREKEKLLQYLENNKKRIDYGKFQKLGLLIGSGAIEAAQRNVIQKRLKLSGQRWTIKGAQQIANLRVAKKSDKWEKVVKCIKDEQYSYKKAA
jgi:hypothetical protein